MNPLEVVAPVRPLYDFQWTPYREAVVTAEIVRTFQKEEVSGVNFLPVRTETTLGDPHYQELYELRVVGWGGVAPPESGIRIMEECSFCRRRVFTKYESAARLFNLEAWDASDMFLVWPLPRFAMATGKIRELILREKFTGVSVEPLSAMRTNSLVPTLTPGHVQDWFDEPRASKLAEGTEQVLQFSEYRS
jgi:hypothetical protein